MRVQLSGRVTDSNTAALYRRYGYNGVCCPDDIRNALRDAPADEELIFEINSGGGSVYDGLEMYTALRGAGRETIGEIGSIAASAASVFAMGCTRLRISPAANMMMHRASTWTSGNSEDHGQAKQMLDTIDTTILDLYDERTGDRCSREQLQTMMEQERFLTAQEAVDLGLADELMFRGEDLAKAAAAMAAGMPMVLAQLPPADELRRRERDGAENRAQRQETADEHIHNRQEERTLTLEELIRDNPELVDQIRQEAAAAERERMSAIDAVTLPGYEDLAAAAKENPEATAETLAVQIVSRQREQGKTFLQGRAEDADKSGVNSVEGSAETMNDDELNRVLDEALGKK